MLPHFSAVTVQSDGRGEHSSSRALTWLHDAERIHRFCEEQGLQFRNEAPKRRVEVTLREDRRPEVEADETGAMDLVRDRLATGRQIRILAVVGTFTRFAPAIEPRFAHRADDVIEVFERAGREHGFPKTFRVDRGIGFVSRALDPRAFRRNEVRPHGAIGSKPPAALVERSSAAGPP